MQLVEFSSDQLTKADLRKLSTIAKRQWIIAETIDDKTSENKKVAIDIDEEDEGTKNVNTNNNNNQVHAEDTTKVVS